MLSCFLELLASVAQVLHPRVNHMPVEPRLFEVCGERHRSERSMRGKLERLPTEDRTIATEIQVEAKVLAQLQVPAKEWAKQVGCSRLPKRRVHEPP
mgnify:FL=1